MQHEAEAEAEASGVGGWCDGTRGIVQSEVLDGPAVAGKMHLTACPPLFLLTLCRVEEHIFLRCLHREETEFLYPWIQVLAP